MLFAAIRVLSRLAVSIIGMFIMLLKLHINLSSMLKALEVETINTNFGHLDKKNELNNCAKLKLLYMQATEKNVRQAFGFENMSPTKTFISLFAAKS